MSNSILNLDDAPRDAVRRAMWLSGVMKAAKTAMDQALAGAYYDARLEGRFEEAVQAGPYARSTALAMTREENRRRGTTVRWRDGLDPTSTAFTG